MRAYKSMQEFRQAMKDHGPYFHHKDNGMLIFPLEITSAAVKSDYEWIHFDYLSYNYMWEDGTECNIQ